MRASRESRLLDTVEEEDIVGGGLGVALGGELDSAATREERRHVRGVG
jgi:hypothetical protein